jgi:TerB N-terminal domain
MSTPRRTSLQRGLIAFSLATSAVLWILLGVVGRSLSAFEILGVTGGVAAVVAVFTWAFWANQKVAAAPSDSRSFDVAAIQNLRTPLHATDEPGNNVNADSFSMVTRSVGNLANLPSQTSASTLEPVEKHNDDVCQPRPLKKTDKSAAPLPLIHRSPEDSPRPLAARKSQTNNFETDSARALVEIIDRNEAEHRQKNSRRAHQRRWYGIGETVRVGEYQLKDAMVYVSDGNLREDEASCIDLSLEVGQALSESGARLKARLSYAILSPNQRAIYLRWLSNGRIGTLEDIGLRSCSSTAWNDAFSSKSKTRARS